MKCGNHGKMVQNITCERPHESLNNMTPEEYRQHNHLAGIQKCPELKRVYFDQSKTNNEVCILEPITL